MTAVSRCDRCGAEPGTLHQHQEGDCILSPHKGGPPHPRARHGWLCTGCLERWRSTLTEITELYSGLPSVVPLGSIPDDTAHHGRASRDGSPALVRLLPWALLNDTERLQDRRRDTDHKHDWDNQPDVWIDGHGQPDTLPDIPDLLAYWCEAAADLAGTAPPNGRDTVTGATVYLSSVAERVAGSALVDEFDADLTWLRRILMAAHSRTDPRPVCRCITVTDGDSCHGRVWRPEDRPELARGDTRPVCDRCHRRYDKPALSRAEEMERRTVGDNRPRRRPRLASAAEGTGKA